MKIYAPISIDNFQMRLIAPQGPQNGREIGTLQGVPKGTKLVSLSFTQSVLDIFYGEIDESDLIGVITGAPSQPPSAKGMMQYSGHMENQKAMTIAQRILDNKHIYQPGLEGKSRPSYGYGHCVAIEGETTKFGVDGLTYFVYDQFLKAIGYEEFSHGLDLVRRE